MVFCNWCECEMDRRNFKKHDDFKCFWKHTLGMKKSEFELLKKKRHSLTETANPQDTILMELKHFITNFYKKAQILYKRIIVKNNLDPIDKIREMNVSENTKENYIREWKLYNVWLNQTNNSLSEESANTYISELNCRESTQKRKHQTLQSILQFLIDPAIRLNKFTKRIYMTHKKPLTNDELNDYLEEQKSLDDEDYLIQLLLAKFGLRINTIALLRKKHLAFLYSKNGKEKLITLPDNKTKLDRVEQIDNDDIKLIKKFIKDKNLKDEDFIFYRTAKPYNDRQRARIISCKINERIKNSKVLIKNPNYKYTSHIFRKTLAYNFYHTGMNELKQKARKMIGHKKDTHAINYYIN